MKGKVIKMSRLEKIIEIIKSVGFEVAENDIEITADTNIAADLGQDSLDMVLIIGQLEEEFGVEIGNDAVQDIRTVGDIDKMLGGLLGE